MGKRLKLILFVLLPIICLVIAGIPFTLADYPETPTEQTMNGTSAEDTGASTADKSLKGGALYISGGASYTMTGGSITGKTNQYGGAVYVTNGSTFTMTGGTITGCVALYGGAIYVEAGGTCNITGGTITGNKAQFAPAIYVEDGGVLNVDQTAVIKDNEYEKYGNALEIYVDGTLAKTMYMKADTYTINEADMPLQYENCCGYFLDEKLSQCSFGEVALTSEAMGFAPRTADAEEYVARLYTRTANPDNFSFTYNSSTQTYDIKAKDTTISGHMVLPKEYNNVQTSIYDTLNYNSGAFYNCTSMKGVTFQEGLTKISNWAFYRLTAMTEGLVIPNSVTTIGVSAFENCTGFTGNLTIGNKVTSIGSYAFSGCSGFTGDLAIPNNVITIGNSAFSSCKGFTGDLIIGTGVTTIEDSAFANCNGLTGELTIGENVTVIDNYAFNFCKALTGDVIIPDSVTSIGNYAFNSCSGLNGRLVIGNSVTTIGRLAFNATRKFIGSLTIPDSVVEIGDYAFDACQFTGTLSIGKSLSSLGYSVFGHLSRTIEDIDVDDENQYLSDEKSALVELATGRLIIGCNNTNISVLQDVISIDGHAFYNCSNLTGQLDFNENLTSIGSCAFSGCGGLTGELIIPDSVTSIGESVFSSCSGLTGSLTIPNSVTSIGSSAFSSCSGFTGSLTIPNSVTSIGNSAFYCCRGLTSVYIPSSVTTISALSHSNAPFIYCSSSLVIYTDVVNASGKPSGWGTYWNYYDNSNQLQVVYGCSLDAEGNIVVPTMINFYVDGTYHSSITKTETSYTVVESDMPLDYEHCCGYFLNEELTKTIKNDVVDLSNGDVNVYTRTADSSLFTFTTDGADGYIITKNSAVTYSGTEFNLVMPREYENKTVTTIADSAFFGVFENCDLINVVFSSEIKTIAKKCFDADEGDSPCVINELNIHDNIETIDDYAFAYCEGIGQLILPDSLKTIGIHAFRACTGLTGNLILPNSITKINEGSFLRCENLTGELIIPNSVVNIGHEAFYGCLGFSSLTLSNALSSLGNYAFYECSGFSGVLVLPDSLRTIGMATFAECSGLSGLTIPVTVTSIGVHSFYNCSGLTGELIISNSVTSIGDAAFYNCSKLTSLTIGNNVSSIGTKSFANCSSFTGNLTIPNSVTSIGNSAFSSCSNLTSLTIGNGVASITKLTFSYCSGLESIYIPTSITTISYSGDGSYPLYGCSSSLVIYTGVSNASSIPSGWCLYWNYYDDSHRLTVNYGYTLEQYKSAVGLTFAPNGEEISSVEVETIENVNDYQVDDSYLQDVMLNKNEYVAILKENEKIA